MRFLCSIFAVMVCLVSGLTSVVSAQAVDGGHARVELISDRSVAVPGETVWLGLSFDIDPNWHIYWKNPGDAGIPPEILWSENSAMAAEISGETEWPLPELLPIIPGEIMDYGYSDQVVLPFPVKIPEDATRAILFQGIADYLICEDVCIPESAPIQLLQSVGEAQVPDQRGAGLINAALEQVPAEFTGEATLSQAGPTWVLSIAGDQIAGLAGEARFFPYDHDIQHAPDQAVSRGANGLQLTLTPSSANATVPETLVGVVRVGATAVKINAVPGTILPETAQRHSINLPMLILFAVIGGLILNLMPCVLPVLSIKAMGVVSTAASGNAGEARLHGLWYTAGVLLSFAVLAAAIVAVRSATGIATWGFWMQNPVIITALVLIVFLIGLWLLGMFELGTSIQNVGDGLARKQGSAGAFFTGVLAVIVGAPCTGPFLGAALGGIMSQPAIQVFAVLLAMGFGLALPFLLLSFVPGLQKRMPKPGAWMETLKQVFAFPMFLTAAYFLWTLGDLAGTLAVAWVVAGAVLVAFGIWALGKQASSGRAILLCLLGLFSIVPLFGLMSAGSSGEFMMALLWFALLAALFVAAAKLPETALNYVTKGVAGLAILGGLGAPVLQASNGSGGQGGGVSYASSDYPTEAWSPQRVSELTSEGRAVFVDFTATWCVNCQANKRKTLTTEPVKEAFTRANVAFLVADYTKPDAVIAAELQKHNRAGVPMYLWYPAGETVPQVLPEILSISLVTGLIDGN